MTQRIVSRGGAFWCVYGDGADSVFRSRIYPGFMEPDSGLRIACKKQSIRVVRGGSWSSSAVRSWYWTDSRYDFIGFRIARRKR